MQLFVDYLLLLLLCVQVTVHCVRGNEELQSLSAPGAAGDTGRPTVLFPHLSDNPAAAAPASVSLAVLEVDVRFVTVDRDREGEGLTSYKQAARRGLLETAASMGCNALLCMAGLDTTGSEAHGEDVLRGMVADGHAQRLVLSFSEEEEGGEQGDEGQGSLLKDAEYIDNAMTCAKGLVDSLYLHASSSPCQLSDAVDLCKAGASRVAFLTGALWLP